MRVLGVIRRYCLMPAVFRRLRGKRDLAEFVNTRLPRTDGLGWGGRSVSCGLNLRLKIV